MKTTHLRFVATVILLSAAAVFLYLRSAAECVPKAEDLSALPLRVGSWQGTNQVIPPTYLAVLGPGQFLSRAYRQNPQGPAVDLFIAYFPSQRAGDTIHSPKNCLPGAGWLPVASDQVEMNVGQKRFRANRYVIENGGIRQLVLYWYQAHGREVCSEYWAKVYLVLDAMRSNRTDGALVRFVIPMTSKDGVQDATNRLSEFVAQVVPELPRFIPD